MDAAGNWAERRNKGESSVTFAHMVTAGTLTSLVPRLFYLTEEKKSLVTTVCTCAK